MDMEHWGRLTALQQEVLREFFLRERGFYLTGGAALAGHYLGHRHTTDLDLFTLDDDAFERGSFILRELARELGASVDTRQRAPAFERHVLTRGDEAVVIDLVREYTRQLHPDKLDWQGIRIDPVEEILANTLTTILSRAEVRDLVDILLIERDGHPVESALSPALSKDGACTAATLAWVLSEIEIPEGAEIPGGVTPDELRAYLEELIRRLRRAAAP